MYLCKIIPTWIVAYLQAQKEGRRQPLFKGDVSFLNSATFSSGQPISDATVAKCQAITGAKCHGHYQATHLDAIARTNDALRR